MKRYSPDFFVIGTVKSGTTWLMECLNYHPEVACFNEIMLLSLLRDGLGRLFNNVNKITADGANTTFCEFNYPKPEFIHDDIGDIISVLWKNLIERIDKDAKIFGEKSPDYIPLLDDIVQWYPNVKFIHIVRDPKDVALSYYYHCIREEKYYDDGIISKPKDLTRPLKRARGKESLILDAITIWKSDQNIISTMKRRFPDKFVTIRYEDMKNPETLNKVYSFLGARSSIELCNCVLEATDINDRPKAKNSFFKFGKSKNWKEHMDKELIDYVNSLLGGIEKNFGYQ